MTITRLSRAGNRIGTSTSAWTPTPGISASVGNYILLFVLARNGGTGGARSISGVTDSVGNTYTEIAAINYDPGGANDGATVVAFLAPVTTAFTATSTITIALSPATVGVGFAMQPLAVGLGSTLELVDSATDTGGDGSAVISGLSALTGDYVGAAMAMRVVAQPTTGNDDNDTLNGNWDALLEVTTSTVIYFGQQGKVVTGDGDQTYDLAASRTGSYAALGVVLREVSSVQDYVLETNGGDYLFTGEILGFLSARLASAAEGTYTFSGGDVVFNKIVGSFISTEQAAYLFAGGDLAFLKLSEFEAAGGTYTFTGGDLNFSESNKLAAAEGTYVFSGADLGFRQTYIAGLAGSEYAFSGGDLMFRRAAAQSDDVTELYVTNYSKRRFWDAVRAKETIKWPWEW
jgi:hypothetical protein